VCFIIFCLSSQNVMTIKNNETDIKLSEKQIDDFRSKLDFGINDDTVEHRNTEIVKIARLILPDEFPNRASASVCG
ncbi:hypothetical protein, partial [Mycoplasmopsis bovis]|uniref:hypothetical protein n=1 Tax=Mycoplasmopsis bovis TaxID=28903 RepID=UPI003D29C0FB